jgi:hypothetical protein
MSSEQARHDLADLKKKRDQMIVEAERLREARECLPRNDKKGAHEMQQEINKLQTQIRGLRPQIVHLQNIAEKQEGHYLWVGAVHELFGDAAVRQCFDHMKEAKKSRRQVGVVNDEPHA